MLLRHLVLNLVRTFLERGPLEAASETFKAGGGAFLIRITANAQNAFINAISLKR